MNLANLAVVMIFFVAYNVYIIASLAIHNKTSAHYIQSASPCNKRKTPKSNKKGKSMMSIVFIVQCNII